MSSASRINNLKWDVNDLRNEKRVISTALATAQQQTADLTEKNGNLCFQFALLNRIQERASTDSAAVSSIDTTGKYPEEPRTAQVGPLEENGEHGEDALDLNNLRLLR